MRSSFFVLFVTLGVCSGLLSTHPLQAASPIPATNAYTSVQTLTPRQATAWKTFERRWASVRSNIHVSVTQLSDAFDEAPFNTLNDELDATQLVASLEQLNDPTISYQRLTQAEMQTMIRTADARMTQVGVLLRDQSRSWTPAQRARASRIRNSLIQTRSSMNTSLQAFTNFRRATPVR